MGFPYQFTLLLMNQWQQYGQNTYFNVNTLATSNIDLLITQRWVLVNYDVTFEFINNTFGSDHFPCTFNIGANIKNWHHWIFCYITMNTINHYRSCINNMTCLVDDNHDNYKLFLHDFVMGMKDFDLNDYDDDMSNIINHRYSRYHISSS